MICLYAIEVTAYYNPLFAPSIPICAIEHIVLIVKSIKNRMCGRDTDQRCPVCLLSYQITCNAVCPNVVRTNISSGAFYDTLEKEGVLTPMHGVVETFEKLLGATDTSGECFEVGPNYNTQGAVPRKVAEPLDKESARVVELLYQRGHSLHQPR